MRFPRLTLPITGNAIAPLVNSSYVPVLFHRLMMSANQLRPRSGDFHRSRSQYPAPLLRPILPSKFNSSRLVGHVFAFEAGHDRGGAPPGPTVQLPNPALQPTRCARSFAAASAVG